MDDKTSFARNSHILVSTATYCKTCIASVKQQLTVNFVALYNYYIVMSALPNIYARA